MKKRIFNVLWVGAFALLGGCAGTDLAGDDVQSSSQNQVTGTDLMRSGVSVPTVRPGWDIYVAGVYRYGPSIIINDDGSIDAWFAAPGDHYGRYVYLYGSTDQRAESLEKNVAAQKFTADTPFWRITANCPNWNGQHCGFTFNLYRWNKDYATTIASTPVASKTFVDYADNENIGVSNDALFPAGTYMWALQGGLTIHSGTWSYAGTFPGVTSFYNGKALDGRNYAGSYALEKTSGALFWDQVAYRRSTSAGQQWTADRMVMLPTEYSRDQLSVCDPGVARWGGYYYMGYTSTENPAGVDNHTYVCRSVNPDGPWEKWNGSGWGGNPQPVIEYTGDPTTFGSGEPSIVVLDGTVYFYYTWNDGNGASSTTTRAATASAADPNWPGSLVQHGTAINKSAIGGSDHCDVKYREDIGKFQAIHTASRMTASSYIVLWQSDDGLTFAKVAELRTNLMPGLHNCGWSGNGEGHIKAGVQQYISYAYGTAWAAWNTRWSPIDF